MTQLEKMKEIEKIYDELKNSALFNLSLASKELFHSNFLYWMAQSDRTSFPSIISNLLGNTTLDWGNDWIVKREYKNFDLCVMRHGNGEEFLFVLENKVKSIPRLDQIIEYNKKLEKHETCKKLLLSLSDTFPDKEEIGKGGWYIKNYSDLADSIDSIIQSHSNSNSNSNSNCNCYVKDYVNFIRNFHDLNSLWQETTLVDNAKFLLDYSAENEDKALLSKDNVVNGSNPKDQLYEKARELRIHDILGKTRFMAICQSLNTMGGITARTSFTNGTPILEVMTAADIYDQTNFIIQIQGKQYRHMIAVPVQEKDKEKQETEALEEIKNIQWRLFMDPYGDKSNNAQDFKSYCSDKNEVLYNRFGMRAKYCKYAPSKNSADKRFAIYRYRIICKNATVSQIIECIQNDISNNLYNFVNTSHLPN